MVILKLDKLRNFYKNCENFFICTLMCFYGIEIGHPGASFDGYMSSPTLLKFSVEPSEVENLTFLLTFIYLSL